MRFKKFMELTENSQRTGAKLGLYPNLMDALGQYPPQYGMASAADLITYIDIEFNGIKNIPGKNGIISYEHPRHQKAHPAKAAN
jgi:hypothetical protein